MSTKLTFSQSILAGLLAGLTSAVINSILFFIFHTSGILSDVIHLQPNQPLTIVPVLISSLIPSLIGACVFFLFERFTVSGFRIFSIVAIILVLLSLASPFMAVQGMPISYGIVLDAMHLVVAFSLLYFINRKKQLNRELRS